MLLLEIAGVDRDTIMADYLLTNDVSIATREKYLALIGEHLGPDKVAVYEPTMIVEESYLADRRTTRSTSCTAASTATCATGSGSTTRC